MPGVGQNLNDHPDVSIVARANGPHGYHKQDTGWNMIRNGLQFRLFGTGPITTTGLKAACFVNPTDPDAAQTHEAYCVSILYLEPEMLGPEGDGYGTSILIVLLQPHSRGEVKLASAIPDDFSDETLAAHCKKMVKTNYHPVGTAKMGADGDPMAVLDAKMRGRGIAGLRVCDMSAVPQIPAGNTNAPAMMLGDRCADLVLGRLS
ncbi:MAG: GMC oxidoreductase [Geminicoccaceae bacterium]